MADNDSNPKSRVDIYGRKMVTPKKPITADMCMIVWGREGAEGGGENALTGATNVSIQYQQQVIRRRTLGSVGGHPAAVIYPTQPMGSMQLQRLFTDNPGLIFTYPGWNICQGTASLDVRFNGASVYDDCGQGYNGFHISGATVTGYNISAEAEGLTIVDNVNIEFLQLSAA